MKFFSKITLLLVNVLGLTFLVISCSTEDVTVGLPTELGSFNVPTKQFSSAPFQLIAPTSNRPGSFSYKSSDTSVAVITDSTITIVGIGTTTITATQSNYQKYAEVSTTAIFNVTEFEPPTLSSFTIPTKTIGDTPFVITAPTSNSAGAFTYTSSNTSVATVSGATVTILSIGTTTITATQAANSPYDTAGISTILKVENKPALLQENFEYPSSTILSDITNSGWAIHSGASTPIQTTSSASLSFSNYYGDALGLAAILDANGADSNKQFAEQSEGTPIYISFVVKVKAPTSTATIPPASYFFHASAATFVPSSSASFRGNIFSIPIANDVSQYTLGLSFSGTSPTQTNSVKKLNYDQNYLVVLKYSSVVGANNDSVSLYIFDENENFGTEPIETFLGPITGTLPDVQPAAVCLRQFDGNQDMLLDAIRVSTQWDLLIN